MDQHQRTATLDAFRNGEITFLVASDVAARGLDIPDVSHIFNYDVPIHPEDYVHRIGRTGRAGREGFAVTLVTPKEIKAIKAIERLLHQDIPWIDGQPSRRRDIPRARRPGPLERTQPARLAIKPQGQRSAGKRERTARQSAQGAWGLARAQSQQTTPAPSAPPAAKISQQTRAAAAKGRSNEASPELGAASCAYSLPPRASEPKPQSQHTAISSPSRSPRAAVACAAWASMSRLHDALRASAGLGRAPAELV